MNWKWNFLINAMGRGGAILVAFVFTPVFVHMMGLEAFSLVAFFLTLLSITFVLDFAFGVTMTRELARCSLTPHLVDDVRDLTRSLEYFYLAIGFLIAGTILIAAPWIARHWLILHSLSLSSVTKAIAMMGVAIGFQAPLGMYMGGLYGLDRQPVLNVAQFLLSLLRFSGAALAMWIFGATVQVFFFWQVGFSLFQTLTMRHLLWQHIPVGTRSARLSFSALRGTFHFTSRVTGTAIASFVVNQLDKIVLSKFMPLSVLGSYQIANQIGTGAKLLATLIETVVMPRMTIYAAQEDGERLKALYHESCQMVALITLPFTAAVVFFAKPLMMLWIGNEPVVAVASPIAVLLTLGSACNALVRVPAGLTLAKGWSTFGLYESVISGLVFVPLLITFVHYHGAMGAASAWLLYNVCCLLIDMPIIHAYMMPGELKAWVIWDALVPAVVSFVVFAMAWLLFPLLPPLFEVCAIGATWIAASLAVSMAMPRARAIVLRALKRASGRD